MTTLRRRRPHAAPPASPTSTSRSSRTVHGPVVGYATVGGRRVAISSQRSSYGARHARPAALPGPDARPRAHAAAASTASFLRTPQTFNAFYADDRAHRRGHDRPAAAARPATSTRACRRTATATTSGAASCRRRGTRSRSTRRAARSSTGTTRSRAASRPPTTPGATASATASTCSTATWADARKHDLTSVISAMNAAATQDLRAIDVVPALSTALRGGAGAEPRGRAQMLALLRAWRDNGGSRLDRDLDGKIDDPGAAIMDAVWPTARRRRHGPGPRPAARRARVARSHATTRRRAARRPAGTPTSSRTCATSSARQPAAPFRVRYCGAGNAATCQTSLWAAIDAAGNELAAAQGTRPGGVARRREQGADHVRPGPAEDDAALHEPADRHPAGHLVQGAPRRAVTGAGSATALERVRALCLALPEATERPSHGSPAWFVRDKRCFVMFLDDHHGDGRLALWCAAPEGMQHALVAGDPEAYFVPPYVGHRGWVGVRLDRALAVGRDRGRDRGRVAQRGAEAPRRAVRERRLRLSGRGRPASASTASARATGGPPRRRGDAGAA